MFTKSFLPFWAAIFFISFSCSVLAAEDKADSLTISTLSGKKYQECRVTEKHPDSIEIQHNAGVARIPFRDLSEKDQQRFGYDPEKEAVYLEKIALKREEVARRKKIAAWRKSIKSFQGNLKVKQTGTFKGKIKIVQVVDQKNVLAEIPVIVEKTSMDSVPMDRGDGRIVRIARSSTYMGTDYVLVWFRNVPTANIVDGQEKDVGGAFTVSGTKTYRTAGGGSETVFVLEPAKPPFEEE